MKSVIEIGQFRKIFFWEISEGFSAKYSVLKVIKINSFEEEHLIKNFLNQPQFQFYLIIHELLQNYSVG